MAKARAGEVSGLRAPPHIYDFRRSRRLSADQMRSLERIHEHFAGLLGTYLTAYLRTRVTCELRDVVQTVFEDVVRTQPTRSIVVTLAAEPLSGAQLIRLSPSLGHALIDRLLGGAGDVSVEDRPFTDIDVHVLERGLPVFLEALGESWAGVERLHPVIRLLEASPQFLRLVGPQEAVVLIDIEISFSRHSGDLTIVLPYDSIKPILPKLTSVALLTDQTEDRPADIEGARLLRAAALGIELGVTALVGTTTLTVADFLELAAGDIVMLEQAASEPIEVQVGGRPKFTAKPFARSRRLCLMIESRVAASEGDQKLVE